MNKFIVTTNNSELKMLIAKIKHLIKVVENNGFDWDAYEASRGADMDIDIRR